ncbi:MAG: ATP-binding protein [Halapricum sp.]
MATSLTPSFDPLFVGYIAVFTAVAVTSFATTTATDRIEDSDTRRGLAALLLTSGGWATAHVGFLLAPTIDLAVGFYMTGLVVGLAAVGPWLYFCSAYTGRSLHRNRTYQRAAVAIFLAIVAVKLTNPIHGLYFEVALVTTPFPYLAVQHGIVHWIVMGFAYSLSIVGYFMLFERFERVSYDTRPLLALVGVTALPIVFDLVGFATPYLIDITYEPIGVAAFAIGVLFIYVSRLQAIQMTGGREEATILLDDADRIREYNDSAERLFPQFQGGVALGEPLWTALPSVAEALEADSAIVSLDREGGVSYYRVSENPFAAEQAQLGRLVVLTDVTDREQYRRELERQNDRLEQFASMVSHDLRNPLNVAMARLELAQDERDDDNLRTAADALERMEALIDDVLSLARQGQPVESTEPVDLRTLAESSWEMVEAPDASLAIASDLSFAADSTRLKQLLENLFRNAIEHGRDDPDTDLTVRIGALEDESGFYVADDGRGIPADEREEIFESGYTTAEEGTGFGMAIVGEIVEAHGWTIDVTESSEGGARFEIRGVGSV